VTPLDNAAALDFVKRLGARLAAQLPEPRFDYTFAVTASDQSNVLHEPLSLPGGYIFVPTSLFLTVQDEAEFAGMLAHAMAHVANRDGTRAATRGNSPS
jgi:predicted Zn-dependent protease